MNTATSTAPLRRETMVGLGIGVSAGVLGLLPWLLKGERLPLQNLWRDNTMPDDFPWSMLPLNQYLLADVMALLAVSGLFAGLALRRIGDQQTTRWAHWGLLGVQLLAMLQSFGVLMPGLRPGILSSAYTAVVLTACLTGIALGHWVLRLTSSPGRWRVAVGVTLASVLLPAWGERWAYLAFPEFGVPMPIWEVLSWLPAVVTGIALAWCGLSSLRRKLAWAICLGALWLLPAALFALRGSVAINTVRGGLVEVITTFVAALLHGLDPLGHNAQAVALAALIGLAGTAIGAGIHHRQQVSAATQT